LTASGSLRSTPTRGSGGGTCPPHAPSWAATIGVNAEDGSRTDDGYPFEFALALAARDADASRVRYCEVQIDRL
jgi:hypothetical protein